MENQNKYLILARRAREEDNYDDAIKYYDMVRTEDPENAEAKFYYSYYKMMNGKKGEAYSDFVTFCNGVSPTISIIMSSDDSADNKKVLLKDMYKCINTGKRSTERADIEIQGNNSKNINRIYQNTTYSLALVIIESYRNDLEMLDIASKMIKKATPDKMLAFYEIGDAYEENKGDSREILDLALNAWKEGIKRQQKAYNTPEAKNKCVGFQEKYAQKIKEYEPTYEIPKKPLLDRIIGKIIKMVKGEK